MRYSTYASGGQPGDYTINMMYADDTPNGKDQPLQDSRTCHNNITHGPNNIVNETVCFNRDMLGL